MMKRHEKCRRKEHCQEKEYLYCCWKLEIIIVKIIIMSTQAYWFNKAII